MTWRPRPGAVAVTAGVVAAYVIAANALPAGLPFGVTLEGLVVGGLSSFTAMGLVLVYRSARIVNFSQATIGGLAAAFAVLGVAGWNLPWFPSVLIGLAVALASGFVVDAVVVRRLQRAPRLVLTVATIGLLQLFGAAETALPGLTNTLKLSYTFASPWHATATVGPIVFDGDDFIAIAAVPVVIVALWWFLERTALGTAVRAAADSPERASLLGVPVRRVSSVVWVVAAGLSGIGAILAAPVTHATAIGVVSGPEDLLAPLAAAVLARFTSFPRAVAWSLVIGVAQQAVFWSYPSSSIVDVVSFGLVALGLMLQSRIRERGDDDGLGDFVAVRAVHAVPRALARLPEVRITSAVVTVVALAAAALIPLVVSASTLGLITLIAIYAMVAVSLVVLTGWAGQVSLGQFAFVGIGAAATGAMLVHAGADLFVALLVAAVVGAASACLIGLPALRLPGLALAAMTMAFATPVSTYLLSSAHVPFLNPDVVARPVLFGRFPLEANGGRPRAMYLLCFVFLLVVVLVARNLRRTRVGRAMLAVRDNATGASAFGVSPLRAKLTAFTVAGAMAGLAGGLYVVALGGGATAGIDPSQSFVAFTMVVIGGLGSVFGAVLGAVYVESALYFLSGAWQLFATGFGMLVLLMVLPEGLGGLAFAGRERLLRLVARRRGITLDAADPDAGAAGAAGAGAAGAGSAVSALPDGESLVALSGVDVHIGQARILRSVDFGVGAGQVVALLGVNGAGKSTTLRTLAGALRPAAGRVLLGGVDVTRLRADQRVAAGMVMAPGGHGVFGSLTVADNLRTAEWSARRRRRTTELEAARARVDELFPALRSRLTTRADQLSGGEQQMLVLAQALLCLPTVLLIDELSLGLAPTVVADLLAAVRRLVADGMTVVVVEQSINIATALAERAVFMERGTIRFDGQARDLSGRSDLLRAVFVGGGAAARNGGRPPAAGAVVGGAAPSGGDGRAGADGTAFAAVGVSKRYGGVAALDDVSISVRPGEILGVIGANGAGKTTLFDICSGFAAPDAGHVELLGRRVTDTSAAWRATHGLGRVFQDARLFPSMTAAEAIATACDRHVYVRDPLLSLCWTAAVKESEIEVDEQVDALITRFGLERVRDLFVSELSTGMRRFVELACVMALAPEVLLLDEPTAGVAQREAEAFVPVLARLREETGTAMVVIEHDVGVVRSLADRLVCMHLGEVIADGPPEDVLARPDVIASYLGDDAVATARSG